jgi:hypothetical protein
LLSEEIENHPMNELKKQITKTTEEYKSNNKQPELPMYKHTEIQRPEQIIPPTSEVIMKHARQKNQEKYEKLVSKAF